MYSVIYFEADMREDEFYVTVPMEIKDKIIYVFKTLGRGKHYCPSLIVNNVNYDDIEVGCKDIYSTLHIELDYLTTGVDDDDFSFDTAKAKKYLIDIADVINIDYVEWNYKNLLNEEK